MAGTGLIVVTGLARSGTSAAMQVLQAAGIPVFTDQRANQFNPRGFYEHPDGLAGRLHLIPDGNAVKCVDMLPTLPRPVDARFIVMRRDLSAVKTSLDRIPGWAVDPSWLQGQIDAIRLWCAGQSHIEVWYEDLLRNTPYECQRIARFLGFGDDGDRLAAMAAAVIR